ncbi:outer membrane beta-barrel family protein [Elizabethkingia sp. HX WHF]|uniref:Outer membrane beta-barrel protein n=1 Tax=Elizabethkingia bruuniana TaxID=1756149 RepID=A0A7T7UXU5_9FLAO|nr:MULTISPECIES: outer membrane beta-barrel family protein [Elizabethkingia]ATL42864.1 TonB-dependent receptor [Elizabethkingia miricola]AQX84732.1 TonB-dependent receptor [Elizabethkingia bruuniana]KGO11655.1 TonB-dependent receptor [Elizabethkingia miricola]KUY29085.1 TonB-dependent receptor [Elizabethkingia bruuniana]MCL1637431.1 outer membrane beta-barrel family protein [Elizabethkingia bruuniana]
MKITISSIALLMGSLVIAQAKNDTIREKKSQIEGVILTARKPTVESKVDRTIFNVSNSSILAGNTTWDVLRMTPLVNIDNNDVIKAEGESVTVYINDRKSVFTGKELKEYLKTIPADNLLKIEIITSPSSRYETTGSVINIVLKKRDDEGIKGSVTFNNRQNSKNSQYTNFNLNYHKKNFTQTLIGSYGNNNNFQKNTNANTLYKDNDVTNIVNEILSSNKSPSISSTSEYELNDKNSIGLILEYYQSKNVSTSDADFNRTKNGVPFDTYHQDQDVNGRYLTVGVNLFYKYYDKNKNKILNIDLGSNYNSQKNQNEFLKNYSTSSDINQLGISSHEQMRNYYIKIDYTQPLGKNGSIEVGGKMDFNNNVVPNNIYGNNIDRLHTNDIFHYEENINSLYINYSKTFFKKLETRIGFRYENIVYKMREDVSATSRKDSYGTLLPNLLLKYSFSENYDLSLTYNRNLWRPWYTEFNPFLVPTNEGTFSRGNMDLEPNPSHRLYMKFGFKKKYFLSARYMYTDRDYWTTFIEENGKIITLPANLNGKVKKYYLFANTNQTFLKNKLNINIGAGWYYIDNHDFNERNNLRSKNYISYIGASANISYTNIFNKNINLSAWVELSNPNNGNSLTNKTNIFHNISATKIFPKTQMEVSLQLMNIFNRPVFDNTTYSPDGTFRSVMRSDWYGFSLSFVKRFGNSKVKGNTKTDVEKNSGGQK